MEASELRIGNWVTYNPESVDDGTSIIPLAVSCIDEEVGVILRDGFTNCYLFNEILPIPLTPEILEKCGFEKANDRYGGYLSPVFNSGRIRLSWYSETDDDWYWYNGCWNTKIKHLHQLQNLYWCLCWEELIVNL